jgi:large subunit ribosomal protein L3
VDQWAQIALQENILCHRACARRQTIFLQRDLLYGSTDNFWLKQFINLGSYTMKFILGTKTGMTQVFTEDGKCYAATVLKVAPAKISQVKTKEVDGYDAVQLASGEQKEHRVSKAARGHFGGAVADAREFRSRVGYQSETTAGIEKGTALDASMFEPGDDITVSAVSKGKGFQGVVKRHGFAGGFRTHGQKHSEREPGSIGATGVARVFKGTRINSRYND